MKQKRTALSRRGFLVAGTAMSLGSEARAQSGGPLDGFSSGLVVDALREIGRDPLRHALSPRIRALTVTSRSVSGPAFTTKWALAREGSAPDSVRRFVFEPVDRAPAGSVWVVASGSRRRLSMFGDLIAVACRNKGIAAAVTDGGCRDVPSMERMGFPVFAAGAVAYGPSGAIRPVAADVPVVVGGVRVKPGDWIVADADGVVAVPRGDVDAVAAALRELAAKEEAVRRRLEAGEPLARAYSL